MADWQASVSFSDRFKWISELRKANPENQASAQTTENQAWQTSSSKEDYETTLQTLIQEQKDLSSPPAPTEDTIPTQTTWDRLISTNPPTTDFGPYTSALYHAQGISSTVYACRSSTHPPNPLMLYALKVTTPSTEPAPHDSAREVRILKLLSGHRNVIALTDSFRFKSHLILVFPFLPVSLSEVLHSPSSPALSQTRKRQVLRDLFAGLAFIHEKGVLHRDIKPSNVLLPSPFSGQAQIIDFGTAWCASDSGCEGADEKVLDVGTTSYRAPELLFGGQKYGHGIDLWAAGCVAAEVVVGKDVREQWASRAMGGEEDGEEERRGNSALFESGDLGSELQLVKSIFETLGTPTEKDWPETKDLPDWGKMRFKEFPAKSWEEILPGTEPAGRDFVSRLLRFESGWRLSANKALQHDYLKDAVGDVGV